MNQFKAGIPDNSEKKDEENPGRLRASPLALRAQGWLKGRAPGSVRTAPQRLAVLAALYR